MPTPDYTRSGLSRQRQSRFFSEFERSWQDQRSYLRSAVAELEEFRRSEALNALGDIRKRQEGTNQPAYTAAQSQSSANRVENLQGHLETDPATGAISSCAVGSNRLVAPDRPTGQIVYQRYGSRPFANYRDHYVKPSHQREWWVDRAFGKHGLTDNIEIIEHRPVLDRFIASAAEDRLSATLHLRFANDADARFGDGLAVTYLLNTSESTESIEVRWPEKDATIVPESLWFEVSSPIAHASIDIHKLGQYISAHDVVVGGGRNLHAIQDGVRFRDERGQIRVSALDTALVALGDTG